ncbi:MAG TPA: phage tail sheath C-terminal domain-containing protein [Pyrinomonadaceae bacterium]
MRKYRTPGVYFERQDTASPLIGPLRTDIAGFVGIAERGPLHEAVKLESLAQFTNVFGGKVAQGYLAYAVDGFFTNGGQTCWVVRVADKEKARAAALDIFDESGERRLLAVRAGSPGAWGNNVVARWIVSGGQIISLTLHFADGSTQQIRDPLGFNEPRDLGLAARQRDALPASLLAPLVTLERADEEGVAPAPASARVGELAGRLGGGTDGLKTLAPKHFVGDRERPDLVFGLVALEPVNEVSIVAMPDVMPKPRVVVKTSPPRLDCTDLDAPIEPEPLPQPEPEFPPAFKDDEVYALQQSLIAHCEKARYRVAVLDVPNQLERPGSNSPDGRGLLPEGAIGWRRDFNHTSMAALYYPWLLVDDPLRLGGRLVRAVPPSGHVAGVYARRDRSRGVHQPPANEVAEGVMDVLYPVSDIEHARLNDEGVNALRPFAGRGIRVFGARTLDDVIRFVNVRRLLLMIEKAIDQGTQWTVFEPNNHVLRREIDRVVRSYLHTLYRRGMLDGRTPDEAYFVKCDEATNPPEEVERGRVLCQIGVQPPLPAEFVVVLIGKTHDAVEVLKETGGELNG